MPIVLGNGNALLPSRQKVVYPSYRIIVQFLKGIGRVVAAQLYIFAQKPLYEHVDFQLQVLFVANAAVVVAQLQKFADDYAGKALCGKQHFVGAAQQAIVLVVCLDVAEKRVDELIHVHRRDESCIVEKRVDKFVFVVLGNAVDVVVVRVERTTAYVGARAQFTDGYFAQFLLFRKQFGKDRFYQFTSFFGRIV